ncbi:alpha/beta hydrolase [Solwaraspora sp. WMMD1047]|uniref:alpha/beta hydrolase n=1 Tax=Solwaraspora sp. WMMD1047 TaxID=3016102 RepID=UPI002416E9DD|nr:alpha/beta hydrolase [Solwaraspora sp. WMMD1047]MDG4829077.1 alpha/beta hydrolase [Solwaraspora sp. WMMD1047]
MDPDVLGEPYECQKIDLGTDDEGPVEATLIRSRADRPTGRAVLYVHGFIDYFFQTHLADFYRERGWDFYALDLRKYGRSLLPHQTANFCRDLTEYFPELDEAARIIRDTDGHDTLLVNGHSTGGLIAVLWADARRDAGLVDGIFLNSPFFDFNASWFERRPLAATVDRLGRLAPYRIVPLGLSPVYGQSLHADHRGEWNYDLTWKPLAGFPVRAGWLGAIRRGQRQVRAGLRIPVPILLACSTRSFRGRRWDEAATLADAVLDVEHMVRAAPRLGRHVTIARFDGGLHDLVLSGSAVRERVLSEVARWADAFVGRTPPGAARPTSGPVADPADAVDAAPGAAPGGAADPAPSAADRARPTG